MSKSLREEILILQTAPYIMGKAESSLIRTPKTSKWFKIICLLSSWNKESGFYSRMCKDPNHLKLWY